MRTVTLTVTTDEGQTSATFDSVYRALQGLAYNRAVRNTAGFPPATYSLRTSEA